MSTYIISGSSPSVRVHAGHEMNSGRVDQPLHLLVVVGVLSAEIVGQLKEQLSAQDFVAVHVGNVLEFGLH